jgi:hypothetical protein
VYRTDGDIHLKAKLGVAYWDDDLDHDTSLSAGIGLGFRSGAAFSTSNTHRSTAMSTTLR